MPTLDEIRHGRFKGFIKPRRWKHGKMQEYDKVLPDPKGGEDISSIPTDIRTGIKATQKFKKGRCQKCGGYDDRLFPYLGKVCQQCVEKHIAAAGQPIAILDIKLYFQTTCLTCDRTKGMFATVNFRACQKCSGRITRIDKNRDSKEAEKEAQRMDRKMMKRMD